MSQPSKHDWLFAQSPNYETNVDLLYPYSEVPYIGQYKLVKIPLSSSKIIIPSSELIDHVDYWGEGRLTASEGSSGFTNCYNVNHQYQLVSNGTDSDRKIPNRIPVISYDDCDTSKYIKENSVKLVTVMGSPINKSCAKDITRIVNADGRIVLYGFESNSPFVKNLEDEIGKKKLLFCHNYKLPNLLRTVSIFEPQDYRAYVGVTDLCAELYRNVLEGSYDTAANIIKTLEDNNQEASITDVIERLLKEGKRKTTVFAYKLWIGEGKAAVSSYFPVAFKLIFNQEPVKIMSKQGLFTLKIGSNDDSVNERASYGDSTDKTSEGIHWKISPEFKDNDLQFTILNRERNLFLKLEDDGKEGDKNCKASPTATELSKWFLDPIKYDDDMLFYIVNKKFNQGLKLDDKMDSNGHKAVLGRKEPVYGQPEVYGWYISPV